MLYLKSFSERIFTSFSVELLDRFKNMQGVVQWFSTLLAQLCTIIMTVLLVSFYLLVKHYFKINEIQDSDSVCFLLKLIDREGGKEIWKFQKFILFTYSFFYKSRMLIKAEFIWSKYSKNCNIVKYHFN